MAYIHKVNKDGTVYPVAASLYGTCSTAAGTATKAVTLADFDAYKTGTLLAVKFSNGNTATNSIKLNVNSKGNKNVVLNRAEDFQCDAGTVGLFVYDGTSFYLVGTYGENTDTLNTAGVDNQTSKMFLVGSTTQSGGYATTYTNEDLYTTDGALHATTYNGYTLAAACAKGVSTTVSSGDTNLVTGDAVATAIAQSATGGVAYKGAVNNTYGNADYWQTKMLSTALTAGWYYVATAAFSIDTQDIEIGDMIFVHTAGTYTTATQLAAAIDVVQGELDIMTETDIDSAVAAAS